MRTKKPIKSIFLLVLTLVLCLNPLPFTFAAEISGTVYYVDAENGDDENDGTSPDTAFQSLRKVNELEFSPGDRLLLKCGGVYEGAFEPKGSGEENNPVLVSSYGEGDKPVLHAGENQFICMLQNISHWVIENLVFTSDGYGFAVIAHSGENIEDLTIRNCCFRDIAVNKTDTFYAALYIDSYPPDSRIKNLHLDTLTFENVAWGIHTKGINAEADREFFVSPEESYNKDYLFENISVKNACCGGMVIAGVQNALIRNCRVIDSATAEDSAYAPLWIRHADRVTVEYCEIAGSTNSWDGMAIDFDGWTTNSTYRYIYSHDNHRFMRNCVFDSETHNSGNAVYNCISVNDNKGLNWAAICLVSAQNPSWGKMRNFSFHDNIIINGSPVYWGCTDSPEIYNIRFSGSKFGTFFQKLFNLFVKTDGFTYTTPVSTETEALIKEITDRLPA